MSRFKIFKYFMGSIAAIFSTYVHYQGVIELINDGMPINEIVTFSITIYMSICVMVWSIDIAMERFNKHIFKSMQGFSKFVFRNIYSSYIIVGTFLIYLRDDFLTTLYQLFIVIYSIIFAISKWIEYKQIVQLRKSMSERSTEEFNE